MTSKKPTATACPTTVASGAAVTRVQFAVIAVSTYGGLAAGQGLAGLSEVVFAF